MFGIQVSPFPQCFQTATHLHFCTPIVHTAFDCALNRVVVCNVHSILVFATTEAVPHWWLDASSITLCAAGLVSYMLQEKQATSGSAVVVLSEDNFDQITSSADLILVDFFLKEWVSYGTMGRCAVVTSNPLFPLPSLSLSLNLPHLLLQVYAMSTARAPLHSSSTSTDTTRSPYHAGDPGHTLKHEGGPEVSHERFSHVEDVSSWQAVQLHWTQGWRWFDYYVYQYSHMYMYIHVHVHVYTYTCGWVPSFQFSVHVLSVPAVLSYVLLCTNKIISWSPHENFTIEVDRDKLTHIIPNY